MPVSPPSSPSPFPAVILAGGRATRMGGGDKGLRLLAGRPLLDHVLARIGPQVGPVALNANGDPARWMAYGLRVLPDTLPDTVPSHPGPLAGVLAAMDWAAGLGAAAVVTAAADTPFLPADLVARLWQAGQGSLAIAATRDPQGRPQPEPTCGLWPTALHDGLRAALATGTRKMVDWTEANGAALAVFDSAEAFFNVNTPADLARAEARLAP